VRQANKASPAVAIFFRNMPETLAYRRLLIEFVFSCGCFSSGNHPKVLLQLLAEIAIGRANERKEGA
jgi:hypothetical protein